MEDTMTTTVPTGNPWEFPPALTADILFTAMAYLDGKSTEDQVALIRLMRGIES